MADPRRYYIDPVLEKDTGMAGLYIEGSQSGEWIKWHDFEDYKAAQRRNASAEMNTKLGLEIAEMRSRIADLQSEVERLKAETVKQIEAALPPVEAYIAALQAENERLRKAGDAMRDCVDSDIFPNIIAAWNAAKEGGRK